MRAGAPGVAGIGTLEGRAAGRFDGAVAALIGLALFFLYCDPRILLPGEVRWLMSGDPAQHFLGWQFFRNTPLLQFPLGANPLFGGDESSSIVFTDSLPLLALLLKPFRALLPALFQYEGAWILLCFLLQPLFAFRLLGHFTRERGLRLLGAALFALAPPMLWRLYGHYSLLAHWTLLAALGEYFSPRHRAARWGVLLAVTALVHAYLLVMVAAIGCADLVRRSRERELTWRRSVTAATLGAGGLGLLMWLVGYFTLPGGLSSSGYGYYRMNLLAPIDPNAEWSLLLRDQFDLKGEYEGFNYLGIAVWCLLIATAPRLLGAEPPRLAWRRHAPLAVTSFALFLYAISNQVYLGSHRVASLHFSRDVERVFNVFRASGRMFWPVVYLIYLAVLVLFWRSFARRTAGRVMLVVLVLQLVDLSPSMGLFRERFAQSMRSPPTLRSAFWEDAAARYRKVLLVPPRNDPKGFAPLASFAALHGLAINSAYYNRFDAEALARAAADLEARIRAERIDPRALYVFLDRGALWRRVRSRARAEDFVGVIDGFALLAPGMGGYDPGPEVQEPGTELDEPGATPEPRKHRRRRRPRAVAPRSRADPYLR